MRFSSEKLPDRLHIRRHCSGLAVGPEWNARSIDRQAVIDGREQFLGRDGAVSRACGVAVASAADLAATNSAAGQGDAPDPRPVITTAGRIQQRGAPNSPAATTSVESSRPRRSRSSISAEKARSNSGSSTRA